MTHGGKREGAGRKEGVPNKITAQQKEMITAILDNELPFISEVLEKLRSKNPDAYMRHVISLTEFNVAKMQRTEIANEDGSNLVIEIKRTIVENKP
jgi:hypothetical protein